MGLPQFRCKAAAGRRSFLESREPLRSHLPWGCAAVWKRLRHLGLNIQRQESSPSDITLTVESSRSGAQCPLCGRVSRRKHSRYTRFLMDLPADGRTVNIHLTVRRFRCNNPTCRAVYSPNAFPNLSAPMPAAQNGSTTC